MKLNNLVKMGIHTLRSTVSGTRIPLNVMLSVTNRCPARCAYCGIPQRKQKELTTAEIITLFDELKRLGTQRIGLWGGEPLIRDDIGELISYARKRCGFFVSLDSNGYLIPQKLTDLRDLNVLVLSLDGCEAVHDRNREPGSHAKVIAALEAVQGVLPLMTITVLTKQNLGEIDTVLRLATKYGFAASFQLLHHNETLASESEDDLMPSNEEYREAIRYLLRCKRNGAPIVSSRSYLEYLLRWPDYRQPTSSTGRGITCRAGSLYCNIDTDGSLYPCSVLVGEMPAPNIREGGFAKAFAEMPEACCKACFASCFTEYNLMHSFDLSVIYNWFRYTRHKGKA